MIARLRPEIRIKDLFSSLVTFKDYSRDLESELIRFFNVKKIIFTQSARAGLYFLFKSLPQKTVFIPSYTCSAVVEAAMLAQKEVVFVDVLLTDYNVDTELLRKKITRNSIILATHQFGIPCDIEEILKIADENQCYVIEDNAAAFGSEYKGKKTGSFAGASVISFEMTKTLTCGRGGAMLFNDENLYEKAKEMYHVETKSPSVIFMLKYFLFLFISKVSTQKSIYKIFNSIFLKARGLTTASPDYESRLGPLYTNKFSRGFIKLAYLNFKRISAIIFNNKRTSGLYLSSHEKIINSEMPSYPDYKSPVFMRFPIRVKTIDKKRYYEAVNKKGFDLALTFPYSCDPDKKNSPNSDIAASTVLNLPIYSWLNNSDINNIIDTIKSVD